MKKRKLRISYETVDDFFTCYTRGLKHAARQMCQCGPRSSLKMIEYDSFISELEYLDEDIDFGDWYILAFDLIFFRFKEFDNIELS